MRKIPLFIVMLVVAVGIYAQPFTINVAFDKAQRGKVTLVIYDGDTIARTMQKKVSKGSATFVGQVERPCYAELNTAAGQKLGLFIENNTINVRFNLNEPEASAITGSRANSQFRYVLEQCRQNDGSYDIGQLAKMVSENKSAVFAPLLIYRYITPRSNMTLVKELTSILEGDATKAYHYRLLSSQSSNADWQMTDKLPDIVFADARHERQHTDSLMADSSYNLIIVGATWCKQCSNAKTEALKQNEKINIIVINIDNDKKMWDAEVVEKLQIDHLPYLILANPKGEIVARDIRAWEVRRRLEDVRM